MNTDKPEIWSGCSIASDGYLGFAVYAPGTRPAGQAPTLLLAAANPGQEGYVIPIERIGEFVQVHAQAYLICYDAADVHWILHDHLSRYSDHLALGTLWSFSRSHRLIDLGLLDQLAQLAETGSRRPQLRQFQDLAQHYYGPLLGDKPTLKQELAAVQDWAEIDQRNAGTAVQVASAILTRRSLRRTCFCTTS
jgi:hypothetical protein